MTRAKLIRTEAHISQIEAAVMAGVSQNTWRLYENNPDAVTAKKHADCDRAVERMAKLLKEHAA